MIDWESVDKTRPAAELAKELGCALCTVHAAKRRYKVQQPKKGRPFSEEPMQIVNVRIPVAVYEEAKRVAKKKGKTFSLFLREALEAKTAQG